MATQTKSVTLNPTESKIVAFTVTPTVGKTYQVQVGDLIGTFVAIEPVAPAEFELSNLQISPSQVYVGETVSISVLVTNVGGETGTALITMEVT